MSAGEMCSESRTPRSDTKYRFELYTYTSCAEKCVCEKTEKSKRWEEQLEKGTEVHYQRLT